MVAKIAVLSVVAVSAKMTNWESHGEMMDAEILAGPALNHELVGNQSTWVAGPNKRFEGMTLGEAKSLMGALQETDSSTFLPFKAPARWVEYLPKDSDWREQDIAKKCPSLSEIRDQGIEQQPPAPLRRLAMPGEPIILMELCERWRRRLWCPSSALPSSCCPSGATRTF